SVSNTIFPNSLWNPAAPAKQLYDRYKAILPRLIKASRKNQRGLYFERLTSGGPPGKENQLDFILSTYKGRAGVRRSALQLAIFDATRDHSTAAQLGFPCLQHVTIAPTAEGISLNAFYATQYVVERAYGNYLGLCRLGRFVAHELGKPLVRMTCFTGISLHDTKISKVKLAGVLAAIDAALGTL
ncbi:MAG: thymidylate synthase, partial [Vicinamibacterales bacterium]